MPNVNNSTAVSEVCNFRLQEHKIRDSKNTYSNTRCKVIDLGVLSKLIYHAFFALDEGSYGLVKQL